MSPRPSKTYAVSIDCTPRSRSLIFRYVFEQPRRSSSFNIWQVSWKWHDISFCPSSQYMMMGGKRIFCTFSRRSYAGDLVDKELVKVRSRDTRRHCLCCATHELVCIKTAAKDVALTICGRRWTNDGIERAFDGSTMDGWTDDRSGAQRAIWPRATRSTF